ESIEQWAEKEGLLAGLTEFIEPMRQGWDMEKADPAEIRDVIKEALGYILKEKKKLEHVILQDIDWNEEILTELRDFHLWTNESEKEKANTMKNSFSYLKQKLMEKIEVQLPELLRDCSDLIKEDSDFAKLHLILNEEMNRRIARYMKKSILP